MIDQLVVRFFMEGREQVLNQFEVDKAVSLLTNIRNETGRKDQSAVESFVDAGSYLVGVRNTPHLFDLKWSAFMADGPDLPPRSGTDQEIADCLRKAEWPMAFEYLMARTGEPFLPEIRDCLISGDMVRLADELGAI